MAKVLFIFLLQMCLLAQDAPRATNSSASSLDAQRQSVAKQLESIRRRFPSSAVSQEPLATVPPFTEAPAASPAAPDCPPIEKESLKSIIDRAAGRHKVDASLVSAVVEAESGYLPCAVSSKGAMGLMQLMPSTVQTFGIDDAFDPEKNIFAGTQFLQQLLGRYSGDVAKALAAYNAGPAKVDGIDSIPDIPETREYVKKVMALLPKSPPKIDPPTIE